MRKLTKWTLFLVAIVTCVPMFAATATDFYLELLRRGINEVDAGRNETAVTPLRLAAFGLLESIEHYETAQAYLVVALDRMNQTDAAREAAQRIVAAERIERRFASLRLPEAIRTAFNASAKKLLSAAEVAMLTTPPAPAKATTTSAPPQTSAKLPQADAPKRPAESNRQVAKEKPAAATAPAKPAPKPTPAKPAIDIPARLAAGERALVSANLAEARKAYRELLEAGGHDHATWIRVAEGLYRSRDFAGALAAFQHVGTLRSGEEAYHYYVAVAAYETGQYDRAKRALTAALPFIEVTPDVERYRTRIEAAR